MPLPASTGEHSLDSAVEAVTQWARRRFGVITKPLSAGHARHRDASIEWSTLIGEEAGLFGLWVDQPDRGDRKWRWRTYVDVGVENGAAWVRVRVHLYSTIEGLITLPSVDAGRPGIVRDLVRDLGLTADGLPMGSPLRCTTESLSDLTQLLLMPGRRLPIVVLSHDNHDAAFFEPDYLADRLLGLAHVAEIDRGLAPLLEEQLGQPLSVYGGAIRIYWPGFRTSDDPHRHRLLASGALAFLGQEGVEAELFGIIGRLAGLSMDEPQLRRRLKAEIRSREVTQSIEERARVLTRLNPPASPDTIAPADYAELFEEFERLDELVTGLQEDALARDDELEILEFERDDAREQQVSLLEEWRLSQAASGEPLDDEEDIEAASSVLEAVQRAATESTACLYLEEAFTSAAASGYPHPARVLEDLRLIDEIAAQWKAGALPNGPHAAFKEQASIYREGIGQTAETRYRADYERVDDNGEPILLAPHIRRGVGAVARILRIYMHFDTKAQRIVIGHVGRKLRDASNRN